MPASLQDFFNSLNCICLQPVPCHRLSPLPVKTINGISPKKLHEINRLSIEIDALLKSKETYIKHDEWVLVDLGSGLGYLSQLLAEKFGYRVLGLEADEDRVAAALKRQKTHFSNTNDLVVFKQHFVDARNGNEGSMEFINHTVSENFGVALNTIRIGLIGLHACADLTVTACKLFCANDNVRALAIMPCCYHKMKHDQSEEGFENIPLSQHMREVDPTGHWKKIINRPFLRLACQQTAARWKQTSAADHRTHGINMFERAKLELLLKTGESVKKIKHTMTPFNSTTSKISENPKSILDTYQLFDKDAPKPWTNEHYRQFQEVSDENHEGPFLAEMLTGLQAAIQTVCEYVVLFDKVVYIREHFNGCIANDSLLDFVELKKIFQEELSPRCYLLSAAKNNTRNM